MANRCQNHHWRCSQVNSYDFISRKTHRRFVHGLNWKGIAEPWHHASKVIFISLTCHQSMGWQAGLTTCQASLWQVPPNTLSPALKTDFSTEMSIRNSVFIFYRGTRVFVYGTEEVLSAHMVTNAFSQMLKQGQQPLTFSAESNKQYKQHTINITLQTCHSISRCI